MKTNAPLVDCFTFCFPPPFLFCLTFMEKKNYIFFSFLYCACVAAQILNKGAACGRGTEEEARDG